MSSRRRDHLRASFPPTTIFCGNPPLTDLQSHRYKLIGQYEISTPQLQARLNAIQLIGSGAGGQHREIYVPLRFVPREKLSDKDRLGLAFDALALSCNCGQVAHVGKIIHGQYRRPTTVHLDRFITTARQKIARIRQHESRNSPPPLILNRHCVECEFQHHCRAIGTEHDDLSLLANFSEKEWKQQHEKGISTVTQLSYTFRPRKHLTTLSLHHQHALRALAIRTNKIHLFGSIMPEETPGVPVYVDVEGDQDRGFYYLIGLRVCRDGSNIHYSFWADDPPDEERIWADFLRVLNSIQGARIVHYGSYETAFFKRLGDRYGKYVTAVVEQLVAKAVNVLSVIHGHVFFPTYSNALKEVANYFGFRWSEDSVSGRKALIWRWHFDSSRDPVFKTKLIRYNAEDCEALQLVAETVWALTTKAKMQGTKMQGPDVVDAGSIKREYPQHFGKAEFVLPQFKAINEAAYWDYQRTRIYVRTLPKSRKVHRRKDISRVHVHPNKVISVSERRPKRCPLCGGSTIYKWGNSAKPSMISN